MPAKTWVYAQFVNPRNGTVLGNIATPIPLTLDGRRHSISRDLEMVAGRAPAGGGYTLQLTPSSSLYDIQRSTGAVNFAASTSRCRSAIRRAARRPRSSRRRSARSTTSASTATSHAA